jgi:ubiquitin C-terminal hydrolase
MSHPIISENQKTILQALMELAYKQLMCFAEHMNDSNGQVDNTKYADYVLYALHEELKKEMEKKGIRYSKRDYES